MTLGERIRKVRRDLDLTQKDFGSRIGMKPNSISLIESGRNTSDQTIFAICREFNVNEEWLRQGTEPMYVSVPQNERLKQDLEQFLNGEDDTFGKRLISLLLRLDPRQWKALEDYARELVKQSSTADTVEAAESQYEDSLGSAQNTASSASNITDDTEQLA